MAPPPKTCRAATTGGVDRVRVLVLSDTHIRAGGPRGLPDEVRRAAGSVDAILHAGDVVAPEVLADLGDYAPLYAVLGNNDHDLVGELPERLVVDLGGVSIGLIHDSGQAAGRARRLHRLFPEAAVVVFGHSHLPWGESGVDGQLLFNPGSPTERRRAPARTFGLFRLDGGGVVEHRLVELGS